MRKTPSTFENYVLTEEEFRQGSLLTALNKAVIHNLRTQYAQDRLQVRFDPAKPELFIQAEAELCGMITVLDYILAVAEAAETGGAAESAPRVSV